MDGYNHQETENHVHPVSGIVEYHLAEAEEEEDDDINLDDFDGQRPELLRLTPQPISVIVQPHEVDALAQAHGMNEAFGQNSIDTTKQAPNLNLTVDEAVVLGASPHDVQLEAKSPGAESVQRSGSRSSPADKSPNHFRRMTLKSLIRAQSSKMSGSSANKGGNPSQGDASTHGNHHEDSEDELEDDDDDDMDSSRSRPSTSCAKHLHKHRWKIRLFIISLLLYGLGAYYEIMYSDSRVSRSLFTAAVACSGLYVAYLLEKSVRYILNVWISHCKKKATKRKIMTMLFYLTGTRHQMTLFLWSAIVLSCTAAMIPRVNSEWEISYYYLTRTLAIIFFYFLFWLLTVMFRLWFAQGFNTRNYNDKVKASLFAEFALCVLRNIPLQPWFLQLYYRISAGNIVHPQLWQQVSMYIHRHDISGSELQQKHVDRWEEDNAELDQSAKQVGKQLFAVLFPLCEMNRRERLGLNKLDGIKKLGRDDTVSAITDVTRSLGRGSSGRLKTPALSKVFQRNSTTDISSTGSLPMMVATGTSPTNSKKQSFLFGFQQRQKKPTATTASEASSYLTALDLATSTTPTPGTPMPPTPSMTMPGMLSRNSSTISTASGAMNAGSNGSLKVDLRRIRKVDFLAVVEKVYENKFEAERFWDLVDPNAVGKINARRLGAAAVELYTSRRNLSIDLSDKNQVIKSMDWFVMGAFMLLLLMIATSLFGANFQSIWVAYSGIVLAFAFIFGDTVKASFLSVIFLFVLHPFDVGDQIEVGASRTRYEVKRIALRTTTLLALDGSLCKMDNVFLSNQHPIYNISTSDNWGFFFSLAVDVDVVTEEFMDNVRKDMKEFIEKRPNQFSGLFTFTSREIMMNYTCRLALYVEFAFSNIDIIRTTQTQSVCTNALIESVRKHGAKLTVQPYLSRNYE